MPYDINSGIHISTSNLLYNGAFNIISLTMFGNFFADTYSPNTLFNDENTVFCYPSRSIVNFSLPPFKIL